MKHLFFILLISFSALAASAQDCTNYYYLSDNSEIEISIFDRKGKLTGKNVYKISNVTKDNSGFGSTLDVNSYDDKGKSIASGLGKFKCSGSEIYVDMKLALPSEQMNAYKDMEIKAEDAFLSYPLKLDVNQTLPDGQFNMDIFNNAGLFSEINYTINNRKVEGKESVTSSAGTWECYKISYDAEMNIRTMGIPIPVNMKTHEWYSPGFGVVKTETFNKNGKLMGNTLLTAVKK